MSRLFTLLSFAVLLAACNGSTETSATTNVAPDRASAAADGSMLLTPTAVTTDVVFSYEDILWGFTFLPDDRIIATDKAGKVLIVDEEGNSKEVGGVPTVKNVGQGGLLDILLDQDFANNRMVYLTWSKPDADDNASTAVGRGRLSDDETTLEDFTVLYEAENKTDRAHHYGSRMVWGPEDGHLYFTIGDRGNRDVNPQDSTRDAGKVYRIAADGSIPKDNPFVDYEDAKKAIYSYGHRNPQGMVVHPETGEIWETEHGPRGGDELNRIEAGKNYGWPVISYGINYNGTQFTQKVAQKGMEQPVHYWVPSIAPSGTAFVTGDRYPGWEGDLLVGSLKFMRLQHVMMDGDKVIGEQRLLNNYGRVRDVRMGPEDYIYVSVEGIGIARLEVE